jgi:hypothetical protein
MSQRTFGVDNPSTLPQFRTGTGLSNAYPLVGPIVISEIMYHPPDYGTNTTDLEEFIELLNIASTNVPIYDPVHPTNAWRLANAVSFSFPATTSIPANGRLVIVPFDPSTDMLAVAAFRGRYGTNGVLVGPYSGKLENAGETLELWRPDAPQLPPHTDAGFVPQILVERVTYSNLTPWPTNADGGGASLHRLVAANYGNDPVNWGAGLPTVGGASPFSGPPQILQQPQSQSRYVGEIASFTVTAIGSPPLSYQWLSNNIPLPGQTLTNLTFSPVQLSHAANYRVIVTNAAGSTLSDTATLTVGLPPVGNASLPNPTTVRLAFAVLPNRMYQVQYKTNLTAGIWLPLGSPVLVSSNSFVVADTIIGQPQRFYRLSILP